jgi:GT2 family glycosyltransferase
VARPSVSVVVPFAGAAADAAAAVERLRGVERRSGDQLIVADNSPDGVVAAPEGDVTIVRAAALRSPFYARNAGAEAASGEWLLFLDADCVPPASLLDDLFSERPAPRCGVVAGEVVGDDEQPDLLAAWARSRRRQLASHHVGSGPYPAGIAANLLVRRAAWDELGGFHECVRAPADLELCWRAQELGWTLEYRPDVVVRHHDPERLQAVLEQAVRYGAGTRWARARYPDAMSRPALVGPIARAAAGALVWLVALRPKRAAFKLVDGAFAAACRWGYLARDSRPVAMGEVADAPRPSLVVVSAEPRSADLVADGVLAQLAGDGIGAEIEAQSRPLRGDPTLGREMPARWAEDESPLTRLAELARLAGRHPLRCLADRRRRRAARRDGLDAAPLRRLASAACRIARAGAPPVASAGGPRSDVAAARLRRLAGAPPASPEEVPVLNAPGEFLSENDEEVARRPDLAR